MKKIICLIMSLFIVLTGCVTAIAAEEVVATEEVIKQIATVMREKHKGDISIEDDMIYLESIGVLDNIPIEVYTGQNMTYADVYALMMNGISKDKEKIITAAEAGDSTYPKNFVAAARFMYPIKLIMPEGNLVYRELITEDGLAEAIAVLRRYAADEIYEEAYNALLNDNIISKDINVNAEITRAELANIIAKILTCKSEFNYEISGFIDVDREHWADKSIGGLQKLGIVNGYEDNTFRPEQPVLRIEMWKMCFSASKLVRKGNEASPIKYPKDYQTPFTLWGLYGGMGNHNEFINDIYDNVSFGETIQLVYNIWYDEEGPRFNIVG